MGSWGLGPRSDPLTNTSTGWARGDVTDLPVRSTHGSIPIHKHELLGQNPFELGGRAGEKLRPSGAADAQVLQRKGRGVSGSQGLV